MDGGAATYAYDGDGRRMKKTTSTETTYTFYGPGGIISEFTTSNAIATATAASSTDKCFYHTSDKLGSAVLVMNAAGAVIENNRTLPYGEAWLAADFASPSTNDKKFTTYQRDSESGLDYAMNRYDSNVNGRFMSVDAGAPKLSQPRTLNRYVYTGDDPINHVDTTGSVMAEVCPASMHDCEDDDPVDPGISDDCPWSSGFAAHRECMGEESGGGSISAGGAPEPPKCIPGFLTAGITDHSGNTFSAADINYAARAVYAEAAGSGKGYTAAQVNDDRNGVASVIRNRVGRRGFRGGVQTTLTGVVNVPNAFQAVTGTAEQTAKFNNSAPANVANLNEAECDDLRGSIAAMKNAIMNGSVYAYTSFRQVGKTNHAGTQLGGNIFW